MIDLKFDKKLIQKYQMACPRYTSYPTAVEFHENFQVSDYLLEAQKVAKNADPLSLYVHLPFCRTICYFCACHKIGTKDYSKADIYLDALEKEIRYHANIFKDAPKQVQQIHWGGGTPTFLSVLQMARLMEMIHTHFSLAEEALGEYAIEVHPNSLRLEDVGALRSLGFNRISMGIQDFELQVQKAINRIQSREKIIQLFERFRAAQFHSVSVDLIYGLPFQTPDTFKRTIKQIIDLSPDRISVFNYAHLPRLFAPQKRIQVADLPTESQKLQMLQQTIVQFLNAGYVHIGMDHFAKQTDSLALAQKNGTLHRTFHGYSTHASCDLIGIGVSAISQMGSTYAQNEKNLDAYYRAIDTGQFAIFRGYELTPEDLVRRKIIMQLACHFKLDFCDFNPNAFKLELKRLESFRQDGLVQITPKGIEVTDKGKLLIRNICSVFDVYFNAKQKTGRHHAKAI